MVQRKVRTAATEGGVLPVVSFDDGVGELSPLTDLREAFDVRVGARTLRERLLDDARVEYVDHVRSGAPAGTVQLLPEQRGAGRVLLVNARCPLPPTEAFSLSVGEGLREGAEKEGALVAACVAPGDDRAWWTEGGVRARTLEGRWLLSRPWHARSLRDRCLAADLETLPALLRERGGVRTGALRGVSVLGKRGDLCVAKSASVCPGVVVDVQAGRVVIGEHATVRPGAVLVGPCFVGPHSTVLERATIRGGTSIGPWCKVNGEVGGTTFQGYSNKGHDGYVGDSWIGEWVNLGAGTSTSNLLNTYGETTARSKHGGRHERTGEQFLGAIIGDHVKTAICTRIMTASVLHTGGMFATTGAVSGTTRPFTWATDAGERFYRFEKFVEVARASMARRGITPDEATVARLSELSRGAEKLFQDGGSAAS